MIELKSRDLEILRLLASGYSIRRMAVRMGFSIYTLYHQLAVIRAALDVATDVAAVVEALRLGLIEMPGAGEMVREGGPGAGS